MSKAVTKRKLTAKQQMFVDEYIQTLNATESAKRARYSEKTAYSIGFGLLKKVEIQEAIEARRAELARKAGVTQEQVINGFKCGAFYDPADCYDENGNLKNIHDIPKEARMAIQGLDVDELWGVDGEGGKAPIGLTKKMRFVSRHQNLDSLAKHLGLYEADKSQEQGSTFVFNMILNLPGGDEG